MNKLKVLIVEDDGKMREALQQIMIKEGYSVKTVSSGEEAMKVFKEGRFDLVVSDLKLPGINGMEVLRAIRGFSPGTLFIIITAYGTIDSAVQAIKEGAENYISKPFNLDEIKLVVKKAFEKRDLITKNAIMRSQLEKKYNFKNIIGNSEPMINLYKMINKIKDSKTTVLLNGATGTGKELVARAIHYNSTRSAGVFLPVNCGALNENLLGSEFFGYVKGSFTGAVSDRRGIFEVADRGSIFLDEIGDVSLGLQQILLRVLENGEIQPVGSTERKRVDVRVIAATNKDLEEMVRQGKFREDLYYRINVITLNLPPLSERASDIGLLAGYFLGKYSEENNQPRKNISREALEVLESYHWPGNVRELENVMERASLLEPGETISVESLPPRMKSVPGKSSHSGACPAGEAHVRGMSLAEVEKQHVLSTLSKCGGNRVKASRILGINRTTLWRIMQRYGL
jgi:DNA-binding NtrC family response regulator